MAKEWFKWSVKFFAWAFVFIMTALNSLETMRALPELASTILLAAFCFTAFFVWFFELLDPGARKIS